MAKKKSKKKEKELPTLSDELQGFNIFLDEFGRVRTNQNIEEINNFLNRNLADRKLDEKYEKENKQKNTNPSKKK
jgi:transcriptional regulator of heat shock response